MKKYLLILVFLFALFFNLPSIVHAQTLPPAAPGTTVPSVAPSTAPATGPATTTAGGTAPISVGAAATPPDGAWLSDNDVTFAGKNAVRSKDLFNWVLKNYQWSTDDNTLITFWAEIRNIIYVFLILLVMITAFLMIVTGGQSFTAIQFIRKFLLVIILITFSFSMIRILYQIIDVIQLFFIKNPDGQIISSTDLLNISFNYQSFVGYRKYGAQYDESAFISLLLTKITAATYFVMAGVLIVRKVILWFFITVSPIYPVLLLYFPIRNTAKIWIGEFFRWLLYAPLFAIFLSGLVVLWRQNINVLPFHFDAPGATPTVIYPTAINILLGGPGQKLGIANNINYTDTFAEYIVALIMLWVVIFLPFLLLRIFLDYFSSLSVSNNPAWKYITSNANKILPSNDFFANKNQPVPPPTQPKPPSYYPTGAARELPIPGGQARTMTLPQPMAQARPITTASTVTNAARVSNATRYQSQATNLRQQSQQSVQNVQTNVSRSTATPVYKSENTSVATSQLVNFPIPTMRDVAKYETSRMNSQANSTTQQQTSQVNSTLQKIANPQSITNPVERQQYTQIKEKLTQAQSQGDPLATSILHAANNVTQRTTVTNMSQQSQQIQQQAVTQTQQILQKLSNSQTITNTTEKQEYQALHEKFTEQSKQGNAYATTILNLANRASTSNQQANQKAVEETLDELADPLIIKDLGEKSKFTQIKEKLLEEAKKGDVVAKTILGSVEKVVQAKKQAQAATTLPQVNQVQTVNLEDYEEVKKTWTENYQKLEIPKSLDKPDQTREEWIKNDLTKTTHAIDLLTAKEGPKVQEGMSEVSALLPFLLVGGFSQAEIVAYLQAKKHAAEEVLKQTNQKQQEEDTLVDVTTRHAQASRHMEQTLDSVADEEAKELKDPVTEPKKDIPPAPVEENAGK